MKLTDRLVKAFGSDKLLHFFAATAASALAALFGLTALIITSAILIIASAYKEARLDTSPDYLDLAAAGLGILLTWILFTLSPL